MFNSKIIKLLIFYRRRILIYRIFKWAIYCLIYRVNFKVFFSSFKLLFFSGRINNQITLEENFKKYRGYKFNSDEIENLKICWRDVYGIGCRIEHILDNNLSVDKLYLIKLTHLLTCFREYNYTFTNNHLVMNLLIIKRANKILNIINEKLIKSELKKALNFVFKDGFFLEKSSHYLFLICHRLVMSSSYEIVKSINPNLVSYYYTLNKFYREISWLGDISPDYISLNSLNEKEIKNESFFINMGSFIVFKNKFLIFKYSLSSGLDRHGHDDHGQVILFTKKLKIYDKGIDDLSNESLKVKSMHSSIFKTKGVSISHSKNNISLIFNNGEYLKINDNTLIINKKENLMFSFLSNINFNKNKPNKSFWFDSMAEKKACYSNQVFLNKGVNEFTLCVE